MDCCIQIQPRHGHGVADNACGSQGNAVDTEELPIAYQIRQNARPFLLSSVASPVTRYFDRGALSEDSGRISQLFDNTPQMKLASHHVATTSTHRPHNARYPVHRHACRTSFHRQQPCHSLLPHEKPFMRFLTARGVTDANEVWSPQTMHKQLSSWIVSDPSAREEMRLISRHHHVVKRRMYAYQKPTSDLD